MSGMSGPPALAHEQDAETYYQRFSAEVGRADWEMPNPRQEQLKLIAHDVIGRRRNADILDVGCGAGVMSAALLRHGRVTGVDFSAPAIEIARRMVPRARFLVGTPADLPQSEQFDVITLFDVLEHVPRGEREDFLASLRGHLRDDGMLIASTPHPRCTEWVARNRPELLQIVDEAVEVADVLRVAGRVGLELSIYRTYDIERPRQYQVLVLRTSDPQLGRAVAMEPRLRWRLRARANPLSARVRRAWLRRR